MTGGGQGRLGGLKSLGGVNQGGMLDGAMGESCSPALTLGSRVAVALLVHSCGYTDEVVKEDTQVQQLPLGPL